MPKAQKHCKLQCVAAFGPHQKTIQIYQKVTLAAAPCLFVLRSPKTWKLQPESRIFEGSASRRHERKGIVEFGGLSVKAWTAVAVASAITMDVVHA